VSQNPDIQLSTIDVPDPYRAQNCASWLESCIMNEGFELGDLSVYFCSDNYLHKMNLEHLQHDTLTDIITFDYTQDTLVSGELYISTDRVVENASLFNVPFSNELHRVLVHGVLHLVGYGDKSEQEALLMRSKEDQYLALLNS